MLIFVSCSGELSREIARTVARWLRGVVQHATIWVSEEQIGSGARWNEEIAKALNDTDFGISCVTAFNQHEPWLIFEAGALAKRLDSARLVPLCIDIAPAEVTGPLGNFQGRPLSKEGMRRLVLDISALREQPPSSDEINDLFEDMWPRLERGIEAAMSTAPTPPVTESHRDDNDMLQEIVERVRRLELRAPAGQNVGQSLLASSAPRIYVGALKLPSHVRNSLDEMYQNLPGDRIQGWLYRDRELDLQLSNSSMSAEEHQTIRSIAERHKVALGSIYTDYE